MYSFFQRGFLIGTVAAGIFFSPLSAQIGGDNTYEFLNLPFSARTAALGGKAIVTPDDDINLVYQNPSLLSSSMTNRLALSYINYFTNVNYGYVTYGREFSKVGMFAAGLQYIDYGKFIRTDEAGTVDGNFFAAEYCLSLSYAKPLDSSFSIGGNLKTIYSVLENYTSVGNTVDLAGTYFNRKRNITAAFVVRNVGYQWKSYRENNHEPMPFEMELGFSKKPLHVPFRFSLIFQHLEKWDLTYIDPANPPVTIDPLTNEPLPEKKLKKFGDKLGRHLVFNGEFMLTKNFNIRLGYNYQRRQELKVSTRTGMAGFSFGFGFKISKFHLSYGFAKYHLAGTSNHITVTTNLADFYTKAPD